MVNESLNINFVYSITQTQLRMFPQHVSVLQWTIGVFKVLLGGATGPLVPRKVGPVALDTRWLYWRVLSNPLPSILLTVSNSIFPRWEAHLKEHRSELYSNQKNKVMFVWWMWYSVWVEITFEMTNNWISIF